MRKLIKGFFTIFICGCLAELLLYSCSDTNQTISGSKQAKDFLSFCHSNYDEIISTDISPVKNAGHNNSSILNVQISKDDDVAIYITAPRNTDIIVQNLKTQLDDVNNVKDILSLVASTGIEISTEFSGNCDYTIMFSESKARQALNPLIAKSKEYLYSKGFSDTEIKEMLEENNVDESELVRLVIGVSSFEETTQELTYLQDKGHVFYHFLCIPTFAQSSVDWGHVGECALKALGADFGFSSANSTIKTWGKTAIKKAFKTIAQKMMGPVGVTIALGEFAWCMWG